MSSITAKRDEFIKSADYKRYKENMKAIKRGQVKRIKSREVVVGAGDVHRTNWGVPHVPKPR